MHTSFSNQNIKTQTTYQHTNVSLIGSSSVLNSMGSPEEAPCVGMFISPSTTPTSPAGNICNRKAQTSGIDHTTISVLILPQKVSLWYSWLYFIFQTLHTNVDNETIYRHFTLIICSCKILIVLQMISLIVFI